MFFCQRPNGKLLVQYTKYTNQNTFINLRCFLAREFLSQIYSFFTYILCTGSGEPKDTNVRYDIGTQDLIFAEFSDGGGAQFEIWHDDTLAISRHRGPD